MRVELVVSSVWLEVACLAFCIFPCSLSVTEFGWTPSEMHHSLHHHSHCPSISPVFIKIKFLLLKALCQILF